MTYVHLAARSTPGLRPFESFAVASWTWARTREAFPKALAVVLMPNHLQLVVDVDDIAAARSRLGRTLGHLQRWWARGCDVWELVKAPKIVPAGEKLARELRYIPLNPCRAGLCRDPLEWPWTTHRDVVGAVVGPWVDAERLAGVLGMSPTDLRANWHEYVSGDPSVAIEGTPLPNAAEPIEIPTRPLHEILCAAAAALRVPATLLRSHPEGARLFVALAREQGWIDTARLAATIGMSLRNVRRVAAVRDEALRAARLCLGDRRLWAAFERDEPRMRNGGRVLGPPHRDANARRNAQPNT